MAAPVCGCGASAVNTMNSEAVEALGRAANEYRALFFSMQQQYWDEAKKVQELRAEVERLRARVWKLDKLDEL